jgi:hypothetical protein
MTAGCIREGVGAAPHRIQKSELEMVPADEITDPDDVALSIFVSSELKQSSSTKQLIYACRKLIEWGSSF